MDTEPTVERMQTATDKDIDELSYLMGVLNKRFEGKTIPRELLQAIIESPYHEQLVARMNNRIVGAATLSITMGVGAGEKGYLNDFVVDPEVRGKGVADRIWDEMIAWCGEHQIDLEFTSNPSKEAAHRFYFKHGATVRETTVFEVDVTAQLDQP